MATPTGPVRSNALWDRIKSSRAAEMFALQERSVDDSFVLAARLAARLWPQTTAINAEVRECRIVWSVECAEEPPVDVALDIEWMLRKVCPCIEVGALRLLQVSGPQRLTPSAAALNSPAPDDDDLTDLLTEVLRTDEQVLHDVLLNPGPPFSDALLNCATREAVRRAVTGVEFTSLMLVRHLTVGRVLQRAAPDALSFALHLRGVDDAVEVIDVDRLPICGFPAVDNPELDGLLVDIANQVIGDGMAIKSFFEHAPEATRQWIIMSALLALTYPEP